MSFLMSSTLPDPYHQSVFYDGVPAKRFMAWIIDIVLISALSVLLVLLTIGALFFIWPLLYMAISFTYRTLTIAGGSATLGMRLMHLQLRGPTGARLSSSEAMIHTGAYLVCSAFALPQLISAVLIVVGDRHQGLHDLLIGSAAINRPR
jgi:hypothetical protein